MGVCVLVMRSYIPTFLQELVSSSSPVTLQHKIRSLFLPTAPTSETETSRCPRRPPRPCSMVILRSHSHRDTETAEMARQLQGSTDLAGFQFYKLMASGMSREKLVLPVKFASELNGRALREVKLRVEGGGAHAWDVEVVVNEYGDMHLGRGWKEFVRANGIELGQLLVFCYDGAALLTVTVFEDSGCGRHCCQREEEDDSAEDDEEEESPPLASPGSGSSSDGGGSAAARFIVTLGQCHLGTKKKHYLNVPVEFSQAHGFTEKSRVVLRMRGQQWGVCLKHSNRRKGNAKTRTALRYGWNQFRVDNGLRVGDICFFQLVPEAGGEDQVLSVEVR